MLWRLNVREHKYWELLVLVLSDAQRQFCLQSMLQRGVQWTRGCVEEYATPSVCNRFNSCQTPCHLLKHLIDKMLEQMALSWVWWVTLWATTCFSHTQRPFENSQCGIETEEPDNMRPWACFWHTLDFGLILWTNAGTSILLVGLKWTMDDANSRTHRYNNVLDCICQDPSPEPIIPARQA